MLNIRRLSNQKITFLSFLAPIFIMGVIFAFLGVAPFGRESLLTIDLGQQYIDFYAEFKESLFNPDRMIYSFSKGLGGEMTGVWAYYLMSPLNLIFFLFPNDRMDIAVSVIILLHYGLASLTMSFLLTKWNSRKPLLTIALSSAYALSGYMINYQFNLMWMGGVILLPVIVLGLERLLAGKSGLLYSLSLAATLLSNYYIGYMICIFLALYCFMRLVQQYGNWKLARKPFLRFILFSLLAAGLSAFLLLPTFIQLQQSKVAGSAMEWDWSLKYSPLDLPSKLVMGAFNFDQLPYGLPNIFVSAFIVIQAIRYFFNSHFTAKDRIASGALILILLVSMNIEVINKIWHGFQNPNWFPYRYSFLLIFSLVLLAFQQIQRRQAAWRKSEFIVFILLIFVGGAYIINQNYDYLHWGQVLASGLLAIVYVVVLVFMKKKAWLHTFVILALLALELTANAALTINSLSYVSVDRFREGQKILQTTSQAIEYLDPPEDSFYRIEKTFQRSKNDAHQANFKSASHFGSTYESNAIDLFSSLGFPAGSGFSSYSNGTLLTDALFGIKYYLSDQEVNDYHNHFYQLDELATGLPMSIVQLKPDLKNYDHVNSMNKVNIYQNPYALPLAYNVSDSVLDLELFPNAPLLTQNQLVRHILEEPNEYPLFFQLNVDFEYHNLEVVEEGDDRIGRKIDPNQRAYISTQFPTDRTSSYYYVLDGQNEWGDFDFFINGEPLYQYNIFYDDVVVNVNSKSREEMTLEMEVLEDEIYLSDWGIYQMDMAYFEDIIQELKSQSINNLSYTDRSLQFEMESQEDQVTLLTIPYDPSWKIEVDGQEVEALALLDSLMGLDLPAGHHRVTMTYQVPYLKTSLTISGLSLILLLVIHCQKKKSADF